MDGTSNNSTATTHLLNGWNDVTTRMLAGGGAHSWYVLDEPLSLKKQTKTTKTPITVGSNAAAESIHSSCFRSHEVAMKIHEELDQGGVLKDIKPARTTSDVKVDELLSILAANSISKDAFSHLQTTGSATTTAQATAIPDKSSTRNQANIRGDRSVFLSRAIRENNATAFVANFPTLASLMDALESTVQRHLPDIILDTSLTSVQIAEYPGNGTAGYPRHCDRTHCLADPAEDKNRSPRNGKHRQKAERIITAVYYLTDHDWDAIHDGGAIRVFHDTPSKSTANNDSTSCDSSSFTDVYPYSGRMVLFRSDRVEHQVLPSRHRSRMAVTIWLYGTLVQSVSSNDSSTGIVRVMDTEQQTNSARTDTASTRAANKAPKSGGVPPLCMPIITENDNSPSSTSEASIFVSIAAFRDSETAPTIEHLFQQATNPTSIFVGLVLQVDLTNLYDQDKVMHPLSQTIEKYKDQIRVLQLDARHATGPCPARAMAQCLYRGEDYVLQIDSHMRFRANWDQYLIQILEQQCPDPTHAVLTAYPVGYKLRSEGTGTTNFVVPLNEKRGTMLVPWKFDESGMLRQKGTFISAPRDVPTATEPVLAQLFAAGFCFGRASWLIHDCPYDGNLHHLFFGEELSMAARLFTHGYDMYCPPQSVCYHLWSRSHRPPPLKRDGKEQQQHDTLRNQSQQVVQKQLEGIGSGMGSKRSIQEWSSFLNVNFSTKKVLQTDVSSDGHRKGQKLDTSTRRTKTIVTPKQSIEDAPIHDQTTVPKSPVDHDSTAEKMSVGTASSFRSLDSAYVQSLAETAHWILNDVRWRTHIDPTKRLFQWELGDNLSVLVALQRVYKEPSSKSLHQAKKESQCQCLLCQSKENQPLQGIEEKADHSASHTFEENGGDCDGDVDSKMEYLHLYCRLFQRRGPWFPLGDIYERYYSNKKTIPCDSSSNSKPSIDEALLNKHVRQFEKMAYHLQQLLEAGFVRGFDTEEECGKTVGQSVLHQKMRDQLLVKMAAGKKRKSSSPSSQSSSSTEQENIVWKQMNQQSSLSSAFSKHSAPSSKTNLLPVICHVNELLLQKVASDILKSCYLDGQRASGTQPGSSSSFPVRVPAALQKRYEKSLLQKLQSILKKHKISQNTCWRLRESPTCVLRRACRLFLCANGGPGDMRSDESNGWKSVKSWPAKLHQMTLLYNKQSQRASEKLPFPPGEMSWSHVMHPGAMARFGLSSQLFQQSHRFFPVDAVSLYFDCCIFDSVASFHAWELCAELRCSADYWISLYEQLRLQERRSSTGSADDVDDNVDARPRVMDAKSWDIDFWDLTTATGRDVIVRRLLDSLDKRVMNGKGQKDAILSKVRNGILEDWQKMSNESETMSLTRCQTVLISLGIVAIHILEGRNHFAQYEQDHDQSSLARMVQRPWLRHLWWEGCLAYILWDIIPIMERLNMYDLAVKSLRVLLFGSMEEQIADESPLATVLLSRRARGKALDRLVIDQTHLSRSLRAVQNLDNDEAPKQGSTRNSVVDETASFCRGMIAKLSPMSQISFAAIRGLARRLKRPLVETLQDISCAEAEELSLRYDNGECTAMIEEDETLATTKKKVQYSDWAPPTDTSVGNAILTDSDGPGGRCIYVGHDDSAPSVNVEELAMECYERGILPIDCPNPKGGWIGWHNEGAHLRALFRILCAAPLLGVDFGCSSPINGSSLLDTATIFLSPYQAIPFDLHVGYTLQAKGQPFPSFYDRRKAKIESYLNVLSGLSPQEVSDAVYDAVKARLLYFTKHGLKDPLLERDVLQLRILSLIAAGCGGKQLAAIFRCLCFDYRHYSGGLPDLLLVRATFLSHDSDATILVPMFEWIGEKFGSQFQREQDVLNRMLSDDEFLGCSKVGDSHPQGKSQNMNGRRRLPSSSTSRLGETGTAKLSVHDLPPKLILEFEGFPVQPECLLVEVKSSNDRLDARQEDWLNVLDRTGQARVCKFTESQKKRKINNSRNKRQKTAK